MNKHPMLSVKEAAHLMGCDERWVRERLNQGQLKGEKKKVGLKDKWFVYAGEVEASLEKLKGVSNLNSTDYLASPPVAPSMPTESVTRTTDNDPIVVDGWTDEDDEPENLDKTESNLRWLQEQRQALAEIAEEMIRPLVTQLVEKDDQIKAKDQALQAATYQLGWAKGRLEEQEEKIKLLPDFQARAEKALQLEQEAEAAKARAAELEANLIEVEKSKASEIERLMNERELFEKKQQEELAALKAKVEEMQKPWWKKMFSSPEL